MLPSFEILQTVAEACGVSVEEIQGRSRTQNIAQARHLASYFLRRINDLSYPAIGKIMGRDHTTTLHSYEKISREVERKPKFREFVERISLHFGNTKKIEEADSSSLTQYEIEYLQTTLAESEKRKRAAYPQTSEDILNSIHDLEITDREAGILLKYRAGMTLEEIASTVNITRERVRQIVMKTLIKELGQKAQDGFKIDVKEYVDSEKNLHIKSRYVSTEKKKEMVEKIEAGFPLFELLIEYHIPKEKFFELFPQFEGREDLDLTKKKRWSWAYDKCRKCGTTAIPHLRKGYCEVCLGGLRKKLREEVIRNYEGKCIKCGLSRKETYRKYKRDFYITKKLAGDSFVPLCMGCFLELRGINMANKRWGR